ncbi:MAG TPA: HEAT repeat domain-containing protein [Longimicrobiales bacterium]|nr:HEAT repeat domain-containing protein [Longimicrobiales bacterium]
MRHGAALLALALLATPVGALGQGLAERITGGGDGVVRMSFPARPGVEICDQGIRLFGERKGRSGTGWREQACAPGPVVVEVLVRGGEVRDVELLSRGDPRAPGARDLATVGASEAVAFLLASARGGAGGRGVEEAVLPAMMADAREVWREVLAIAEDGRVGADVRRTSLFWLGQEAAEAATAGLAGVAADEGEDQEVRTAAIFALSRRPEAEGVPILMELARTAREPATRRAAFFWLAQSRDERVAPFFRSVLLGNRGG